MDVDVDWIGGGWLRWILMEEDRSQAPCIYTLARFLSVTSDLQRDDAFFDQQSVSVQPKLHVHVNYNRNPITFGRHGQPIALPLANTGLGPNEWRNLGENARVGAHGSVTRVQCNAMLWVGCRHHSIGRRGPRPKQSENIDP